MKKSEGRSKGTWWHRFIIRILTLVLALLVFWLLGFLVGDIRSIEGPDYAAIEEGILDQQLIEKAASLNAQIAELNRTISNEAEKRRVLGDGSRSLQQTITQLVELQKLRLENSQTLTAPERENLNSTLSLFLENQKTYQELSQSSTTFLSQKQDLESQLKATLEATELEREPARVTYREQMQSHRLKLAFWQLAVLLPILMGASFLLLKQRGSMYFPLFLALGLSTLTKVGLVVHEYFPTKYFKYVLIGALLIVVGKMLIHFLRLIAFPKTEWLVKQYREAYERFLCPVCDYPIRSGPRRYLFWTRRSVAKLRVPISQDTDEEPYTCPCCGKGLFEECSSCHKIRYSLLPHCQHCGESVSLG